MKRVKRFDHFMWLKVTGKMDNVNISDEMAVTIPSQSLKQYEHNLTILKEHGIEYPNWKDAKEVLKEINNGE